MVTTMPQNERALQRPAVVSLQDALDEIASVPIHDDCPLRDTIDAVCDILNNGLETSRAERETFLAGRKQGWQDAGLSLDAQDTLTAALNTVPEREAL